MRVPRSAQLLLAIQIRQRISSKRLLPMRTETVRMYVGQHPNTPVATLVKLSSDNHADAIFSVSSVASNPNCTVTMLEVLAKDARWEVREAVVENPTTPAYLRNAMASDDNHDVRARVAIHTADQEVLARLSQDPDGLVRMYTSQNPACAIDLMSQLAMDKEWAIRAGVACNRNCPAALLSILANDSDARVRCDVAKNPNCTDEILGKLVTDTDDKVRDCIVQRHDCPQAILSFMATDRDPLIRSHVAIHYSTPIVIQLQMACFDVDEDVREDAKTYLQSLPQAIWPKVVASGTSLSKPISDAAAGPHLGDALLRRGLADVYQFIQSAELTLQLHQAASQDMTTQNTVPASPQRLRM